jgi:phosphatidylglycerophosphatase A
MRSAVVFLASVAYVGYIPIASGTFGSAVAIPLFWGFHHLRGTSVPLYLLTFVAAVAAACWVAGEAEKHLAEHDSSKIVIDEVVGYLAATLFIAPTLTNSLLAFLIFRVLDVIKPFPANRIDKNLPGGPGVVLDDVVSGLYSNVILQILLLAQIL